MLNAAEGETPESSQSRSRRETALLEGSSCCWLCERELRFSLSEPSLPCSLPLFFSSASCDSETTESRRKIRRNAKEEVLAGVVRRCFVCGKEKGGKKKQAHAIVIRIVRGVIAGYSSSFLVIVAVTSSCHVIPSTVTSRRTGEFCDLDVPD